MKIRARSPITRLCLTVLASLPTALTAQTPGPLSPGDEVRVSWSSQSGSRTYPMTSYLEFVRMDESQIVGRRHGRLVVIDTRRIRSVRRRIGTKPASAPAMVIGSGAGFAVGFLAGAVGAGGRARPGNPSAADAGLSTGVLVGAPLGALIAWIVSRSHGIYEEVPIRRVRPVPTLSPSGGLGVSLRLGTR